jgi:hypothetical protein
MFSLTHVRRRDNHPQCGSGNHREMKRGNEIYHLVFWLLGTLNDLRDRV